MNEPPHGRGPVGTTDYGGTVTSLSLCNSYTIQYLNFGLPGYYNLFTLHCFCFHSGPAENQVGKPHLQFGRASLCRHYALLGLPVAKLLNVLATGTQHQTASTCSTSVPLCPSTTSSMPSSPPSVPIAGITDTEEPVEAQASTSKLSPPTSADIEAASPKCHQIIPVPIPTTTSKSSSLPSKLPVIHVPELAAPAHALPEWIDCPGGCKDYKCQLYAFQHTNRDCMLMHIWQHLEISIGCPMCRKGFQNAASLCKHGKKVHSIHIV